MSVLALLIATITQGATAATGIVLAVAPRTMNDRLIGVAVILGATVTTVLVWQGVAP